jgi:hypothetical protein
MGGARDEPLRLEHRGEKGLDASHFMATVPSAFSGIASHSRDISRGCRRLANGEAPRKFVLSSTVGYVCLLLLLLLLLLLVVLLDLARRFLDCLSLVFLEAKLHLLDILANRRKWRCRHSALRSPDQRGVDRLNWCSSPHGDILRHVKKLLAQCVSELLHPAKQLLLALLLLPR